MDSAVFRYASVESSDTVSMRFPYKNHRPELTIRTKNGGELNVLLQFSGQAQAGIDGGKLRLKFDSGPAQTWSFARPADHGKTGLIFINNERSFLSQLAKSKTLMVELPYYSEGRKTFAFDVQSLDNAKLGIKSAAPKKASKS
jgi:hypothetical protein